MEFDSQALSPHARLHLLARNLPAAELCQAIRLLPSAPRFPWLVAPDTPPNAVAAG
jgi:hypothetical protein